MLGDLSSSYWEQMGGGRETGRGGAGWGQRPVGASRGGMGRPSEVLSPRPGHFSSLGSCPGPRWAEGGRVLGLCVRKPGSPGPEQDLQPREALRGVAASRSILEALCDQRPVCRELLVVLTLLAVTV